MYRVLLSLLLSALLSACQLGEPRQLSLSMSAYTQRPVVVMDMTINGTPVGRTPAVVRGRADTNRPQSGSNRALLNYPSGAAGIMALDVTWVELPSGAAYSATVDVPLADLERRSGGGVEVMPIFAPGGLLIVSSDPVPVDANDKTIRDVVRLCATRTPSADKDFTAQPGELAALREALAAARTTPAPPCRP